MSDPTDPPTPISPVTDSSSPQEETNPVGAESIARALAEIAFPKPKKIFPETVSAYRWLEPAPIYCDHFAAQALNAGKVVRISFGEYVGKEYAAIYRTSVALTFSEAKRLVRTLTRIVKEAEEEGGDAKPPSSES
jgi:hypothetical protein